MVIPYLVLLIVYFVVGYFSHFRSNFFNFRANFGQLLSIFRAQFQYFRSTICRSLEGAPRKFDVGKKDEFSTRVNEC